MPIGQFLEVYLYSREQSLPYQLRLSLGDVQMCTDDRLESNDSQTNAEPLSYDLYRDLSACVDEDWYKTTLSAGRDMIIYLTYDQGIPYMEVQDEQGQTVDFEMSAIPVSDGCLETRTERCPCFVTGSRSQAGCLPPKVRLLVCADVCLYPKHPCWHSSVQ